MEYHSYREFCLFAKYHQDNYWLIEKILDRKIRIQARSNLKNIVYNLPEKMFKKDKIWEYLNKDITLEELLSYIDK